jgi:hypothetical protein
MGEIIPEGDSIVIPGSDVFYYMTPEDGYRLSHLMVNGARREADRVYAMMARAATEIEAPAGVFLFENVTGDSTIVAYFERDQFVISASDNGVGGTISPVGDSLVTFEDDITYTFKPEEGYELVALMINDSLRPAPADLTYTFENVAGDSTIQALFALKTYTVTATVNDDAKGSIDPEGITPVAHFGSMAYVITPNEGFDVDSVYINGVYRGKMLNYMFENVSGDSTISVVFGTRKYLVNSRTYENGTISPLGDSLVLHGESITYTMIPDEGYKILRVIADHVNTGDTEDTYTFSNVEAEHTIHVRFTKETFSITIDGGGKGGTVTPSGEIEIEYGDTVPIKIIPDEGYYIDSVIVNDEYRGDDSTYSLDNVRGDSTVRVVFDKLNKISITQSEGGTISPAGDTLVKDDVDLTYSITPNEGYVIDSVFVNGLYVGNVDEYEFKNIQGDSTIRVVFAYEKFTITASAGEHGSITPDGDSLVTYGNNVRYTIIADRANGYQIDSLFVDEGYIGQTGSYQFANVQANHTIRATFILRTLRLIAESNENGTITPDPADVISISGDTALIEYGSDVTYTITPDDETLTADSVFINGIYRPDLKGITEYTFNDVKGDSTIRIAFAIKKYHVTGQSNRTGGISPMDTVVEHGGEATLMINVPSLFIMDSLYVNGKMADTNLRSYTFSNVTGDSAMRVRFKRAPLEPGYHYIESEYTPKAGGTMSPEGPLTAVVANSNQAYTITPSEGYKIDSLFINDISITPIKTYTFNDVQADSSIRVVFAKQTFIVDPKIDGEGGYLSPEGPDTIEYGDYAYFEIITEPDYYVDSVFVNGEYREDLTLGEYIYLPEVYGDSAIRVVLDKMNMISANNPIGGTITPPGNRYVKDGESVAYTITPDEGYYMDSLFINGVSIDTTRTYTFNNIQGDSTIRVVFDKQTFRIIIDGGGKGGTITPTDTTIDYGEDIPITIIPDDDYYIDSVFVNDEYVGDDSTYTLEDVRGDSTVRVVFDRLNKVTASAGPNGSILPAGDSLVKDDASIVYTFTATTEGYTIDSLFVNETLIDVADSYTFTNIQGDSTIRVVFGKQKFTINIDGGNGTKGTVTPSGEVEVEYGEDAPITITPKEEYYIDSVFINDEYVGDDSEYTLEDIRGDSTVRVVFDELNYVRAKAGPFGNISPEGDSAVKDDASITYTITPRSGYLIDSVIVDDALVGQTSPYTISNIQGGHTIRAVFKVDPSSIIHTVFASAGEHGSISLLNGHEEANGEYEIGAGGHLTFMFTPEEGYRVDSLFVNDKAVDTASTYMFDNVLGDSVIHVTFTKRQFTIHIDGGGEGGTITPTDTTIDYGEDIPITIIPNDDYYIDSVFINDEYVGDSSDYTLEDVRGDSTVRVVFDQLNYVRASAGPYGTISPVGDSAVKDDASITYTFTPFENYGIDSLFVNDIAIESASTYTIANIQGDSTIHVTFKSTLPPDDPIIDSLTVEGGDLEPEFDTTGGITDYKIQQYCDADVVFNIIIRFKRPQGNTVNMIVNDGEPELITADSVIIFAEDGMDRQKVELIISNGTDSKTYTFNIFSPLPSSLLHRTFDATIAVINNVAVNGGYNFTTDGYTWFFDDIEIADGGNSGVLYAKPTFAPGKYKAQVTYTTGETNMVCPITVDGNPLPLKVYPNPTTDIITVEHAATIKMVEVYSQSGLLLKTVPTAGQATDVDLQDLPNGSYVVRCEGKSVVVVKK